MSDLAVQTLTADGGAGHQINAWEHKDSLAVSFSGIALKLCNYASFYEAIKALMPYTYKTFLLHRESTQLLFQQSDLKNSYI